MTHIQGTVRDTETVRIVQLLNVPPMESASKTYRFFPKTMEIVFRVTEAPDAETEVTVKVSGPIILDDGSTSAQWMSRRFFGDLGIDSGPGWIRQFVESFRTYDGNHIRTDTLRGEPADWA